MSIKLKFVLSHLVAALLPLGILAAMVLDGLQEEMEAAVATSLLSSSQDAVARIEREYATTAGLLEALARRIGAGMDPEAIADHLQEMADRHSQFAAILLLGPEGRVVAASRPDLAGLVNLSSHPQVRAARIGQIGRGAVEVQPFGGRKGFALALPVREGERERVQGIVLAIVDWRPFETQLSEVRIQDTMQNDGHRLLVLQKESAAVVFSGPGATFPDDGLEALIAMEHNRRRHRIEAGEAAFLGGSTHTHHLRGLPDPGWVAFALIDEKAAFVHAGKASALALAAALSAGLITVVLGYVLAARLAHPIQAMTGAFRDIAAGDLGARFDVGDRDDEIGRMASALEVFRGNLTELSKLSQAMDQSPAAIIISNAAGIVEYVNPKFLQTSGYGRHEVIGASLASLKFGDAELHRQIGRAVTTGGDWHGELQTRRKDGSQMWEFATVSGIRDADGRLTHALTIKEDISVRKQYEEQLAYQYNYDGLTGLPNRALAHDRLNQVLRHAGRRQVQAAVILADINRLHGVNDTFGHDSGDEVLRQAAGRLMGGVREEDTVARLGGDQFLIILGEVAHAVDAERVAGKLAEALELPFLVEDQDVCLGASFGIALFPRDGADGQTLVRNADAALNRAKESGGNTRCLFTPDLHERINRRLAIENALRHALERDEFTLHYHPLVDAVTGRVVAAEALIRWTSATLGAIPPDHFIPIAEESGLIVDVGTWVIRTACQDLARWDRSGLAPFRVAVNVSARQFANDDLPRVVRQCLQETGMSPERLEVEVTERLLLDREGATRRQLELLKEMGVRMAIDDFGTGYSAMSYLTSFPFDVLKIDRSFVLAATSSRQDAALTQAIIAMAYALGLEVVAEGVEEACHVDFMRRSGCHLLQGFYFTKPLPSEAFAAVVRGWEDRMAERPYPPTVAAVALAPEVAAQ